jgi:hypothetical protein
MAEAPHRALPRRIRNAAGARIRRVVEAALAARLDVIQAEQRATKAQAGLLQDEVLLLRDEARARHRELESRVGEVRDIVAAAFDHIPRLRSRLVEERASDDYARTFADSEPLVSIRIATWNRGPLLFERAVSSVLAQSYQRIELVIVGDGCDDDTAERTQRLGDSRVTFVNLPHRGVYPSDPRRRWMVAGARAMNLGAELVRGSWIAPLDDDDEFTPDHVEVLLRSALAGRFEMVYGVLHAVPKAPAQPYLLGSYPPKLGQFGFQAALYLSQFRFFEYETSSWVLDEPADWNLCRRMLQAGVRIGYVDRPVATIYPAGPDI